ncbi:MAG: amidohydrolase [Selenomonadaceae bacterium]|nr:amidohydrolase [Selenomonadaceae bacterium]
MTAVPSSEIKQLLCQKLDELAPVFHRIADYLHQHPELSGEEENSSRLLQDILSESGFSIAPVIPDKLPTAFHGIKGSGPVHIGFLAEYDALPELGHGCGHNLIAAMSTTAAIACADIFADEAAVHIFGCPAEETIGGKVFMSEAGVFAGLDAALICHPSDVTAVGGTSYATHPVKFTFTGKPAHVADPDYHGINALDALVDFYQQLGTLQRTFTEPHIIGKIITEGGTAPNIVPERAAMKATIRALRTEYLEDFMLPRIKELAQQVSQAHGTELEMEHYEPLFKNLINDRQLSEYMKANLEALGTDVTVYPADDADGSTDVGNVSHDAPTIQPEIKIGEGIAAHTYEFAAAAGSEYGKKMALLAAKAMAMTAADVILQKETVKAANNL